MDLHSKGTKKAGTTGNSFSATSAPGFRAPAGKEWSTWLSFSRDLASVRDKKELVRIIGQKLGPYFAFEDFLICTPDAEQESYRAFAGSDTLMPDEAQNDMARMAGVSPCDDGFFRAAFGRTAIKRYDVGKLQKDKTGTTPYIQEIYQKGIREIIAVPLRKQEDKTGFFFLMFRKKNAVKTTAFDILEGLSIQLAITLANIIANEEIACREHEKSILLCVGNSIAAARHRKDLQDIVNSQVLDLFSAKFYTLCLLHENGNTHSPFLHSRGGHLSRIEENEQPVIHEQHKVQDGIFDAALAASGPLVFLTGTLITRQDVPPYIHKWHQLGIREIMVVKVMNAHEPKGVLYLYAAQPGAFSPDKFGLLDGIAAQLGTGICNILANEKVERQLLEINQYKLQLQQENLYLQEESKSVNSFAEIVGAGPEIKKIFHLIGQVAAADATVLLLGETGTGKELIARAIHGASPRKDKLMIKVNCAALPANLIESELFGHEKGSFTGSLDRRIGKFELAHKSTLFLDEIGELPLELQVKLLRALQEKEIERIGGRQPIKVDVRIIAATNRNLQQEVEAGRFRSDLFYRLNVFPITLPPLRNRKEDIPLLTSHFISRYAKNAGKTITNLSHNVMKDLMSYTWPGNIRELQHLVERSVLLTQGPTIKEMHLPITEQVALMHQDEDFIIKPLEQMEKEYILKVVRMCGGRISGPHGAALKLGIPPTTLISKMQRLGIRKEHFIEKA